MPTSRRRREDETEQIRVVLTTAAFLAVLFGPGCDSSGGDSTFPPSDAFTRHPIEPGEYPDIYVYDTPGAEDIYLLDTTVFYALFVEEITGEEFQSLMEQYGLTVSDRFSSEMMCPPNCLLEVPPGKNPRDYFVDFIGRDPNRFGEEPLVEFAAPVYYHSVYLSLPFPPSQEAIVYPELSIHVNRVMTPEEEVEFLTRYGLDQTPWDWPGNQFLSAALAEPKKWTVFDAVELVKADPEVVWAGPAFGYLGMFLQTPADEPDFGQQWYLNHPTRAHIDMVGAWGVNPPVSWGDPSVVIAVIDTGVDVNHTELTGKLTPGWDILNNNPFTDDFYGHGTGVASIIAANSFNGNMAGVCPNCSIMPLQVFDTKRAPTDDQLGLAVNIAVTANVDVINMSLGHNGACYGTLGAELANAFNVGITAVASSGNKGEPLMCPANLPSVIAVGASRFDGNRVANEVCGIFPWSSNFGSGLDLVAPGLDIYTATLASNGSFTTWCGTSFSAPQVAGVSGLMYSEWPGITPWDVLTILVNSTDDVNVPGYDFETGYGKLNAFKALSTLLTWRPVAAARAQRVGDTAWFQNSISVRVGDDIALDGATLSGDPKGGAVTCSWSPQGTAGADYFIDDPSSCLTTMRTYTNVSASFNIELTVADSTGWQSVPDALTVNALIPPVADAYVKEAGSSVWVKGVTVVAGDIVDMDGLSSYDPKGGNIVSCRWWPQYNAAGTVEDPNACRTVLRAGSNGTGGIPAEISLFVTDDSGIESFPDIVTVDVQEDISLCPTLVIGAASAGDVSTLRRFRDEVLAKGAKGERYVDLYYKHGPEVAALFVENPSLGRRHWGFISQPSRPFSTVEPRRGRKTACSHPATPRPSRRS